MRILVVSPDFVGADTAGELAGIMAIHQVEFLYEHVTPKRLFDLCGSRKFDVIHFLTHGGPDGVVIDSDELLDPDDIAMLCRMAGARLVFFNACSTARPATYITRHGVPFSIFATIEIPMAEAWQRPAAFYRACVDASDESILSALLIADGGDARYSHVIRPEIFLDYIREVKALRETQVVLTARVSEMRADVDRIAQVITARPTVSPRANRMLYLFLFLLFAMVASVIWISLLNPR